MDRDELRQSVRVWVPPERALRFEEKDDLLADVETMGDGPGVAPVWGYVILLAFLALLLVCAGVGVVIDRTWFTMP